MTDDEITLIRQALYVAADTRIVNLCGVFGLTARQAGEFQQQAWQLHEDLRKETTQ